MSNLAQRVISGVIMAALFLAAVWAGGAVFTLLMAVIAFAVWAEWCDIAGFSSDDRLRLGGFAALGLMVGGLLFASGWLLALSLLVVFAIYCGLALSVAGGQQAIGGIIYAGGLMAGASLLRGAHADTAGLVAILFLCGAVWGTDIGAYFAGRSIGGPKLAPAISPNKTISGALGGVIAAMIVATIIYRAAGLSPLWVAAVLAAFLSGISQVGDLFESWLKRRAGIKDSGRLIPGHGGAMDRVDGLVFATIALWICGAIFSSILTPAAAFFG